MTDTCGALRDVALLPFPYQGCVAPESAPITWISTEVVFAKVSESVFVRSLFRPHLTFKSGSRLCYLSLVIINSFAILTKSLTTW